MSAAPLVFTRQGRSPRALLALALAYALMAAALLLLDAAWWIVAFFALLTLPALHDLWRNPQAGLQLDNLMLHWHSGRRQASVALAEIDHMRLDTRWDFSVRATAILTNRTRLRIPAECLPPHRAFEAALEARGVAVQRHHFTVF